MQQQRDGQSSRALADYLAREGQREQRYPGPVDFEDVDDEGELVGFDARKRSIFRERDGMYNPLSMEKKFIQWRTVDVVIWYTTP